jgi:catechol 2,3-dioxygenase-like lactoylglutathione lyase family enzyme
MTGLTLRIARPTNDLSTVVAFYAQALGFETLASFEAHDGFDGVIVGRRGCDWHLEFTHCHGMTVDPAPTPEHLLVLYLPDRDEWNNAIAKVRAFGGVPCLSANPYWDRQGVTFEDPDGYRVVLQNASWGVR